MPAIVGTSRGSPAQGLGGMPQGRRRVVVSWKRTKWVPYKETVVRQGDVQFLAASAYAGQ